MSLRTRLCLSKIEAFFYYVIIGAAVLFAFTNILQYYSIIPERIEIDSYISDINIDTVSMTLGATAGGFIAKLLSFR